MRLAVRAKRAMGAVAVAAMVTAGFGAAAGEAQATTPEGPAYEAARVPVIITGCKGVQITVETRERDLFNLHNAHRVSVGVPRLCVEPSLQRAAEAHASDMAARNYLSHVSPEGTTPTERAERAGYKGDGVGENAAASRPADTASDVFNQWLGSPGHRENLELDYYVEVGIASADPTADNLSDAAWSKHVALFAYGVEAPAPTPTPAPAPAPAPAPVVAPNAAPAISGVKPAAGSATRDRTPLAQARVKDANTRLAVSQIKVYVDGRRVKVGSYNASTGAMKAQLPKLARGKHALKITATDGKLLTTATSRFTVR